jgi:glycosyltransferase involved in cell wall biosynthesis
MKVVIATPIYPPEIGGPATYTKELCERLHDRHELTVVAYTDVHEAFEGTRLVAISKRRPLPIRLVRFFFAMLKASKDADIVYVQNAMAAGLPVSLACLITGKPYVLKFVGDEAWERASQQRLTSKLLEEFLEHPEAPLKIRLMMSVQGFVLRRASRVTTPSIYLGQAIQRAYGIDPRRIVTNYNAAEETVTLPFEAKPVRHQIAATARLTAFKGIDGIIRAVAILKQRVPDVKLAIAGEGPEMENLQKLSKELGVEDRVYFLGKISRAETWQLRKNSEVYVLNSTYEGLPHTVLTSFAAEIPTVATNIPGTNEALYNEETGLLVDPGDDEALANAIERYFNDKTLCEKMVKNGRKLLEEKFSWKAHIANLERLFQSALYKPAH